MNMDVSICIVSWNTRDILRDCLQSIVDKTHSIQYEVIVVDNASSDESADMVRNIFPDCKLIESGENLGFARGNNLAVEQAIGKYILYLNPDTTLITNAIDGMYRFLEGHDAYGAVGCKLVFPDGRIQYTCAAAFPMPFNTLSALLLLNRVFPRSPLFAGRELDYWNHEDSRDIECLSGACIMARKSIIDKIGGFDDNIFMYSEDLDLCLQILKRGWKIFYLADETIIHHEGVSTKVVKKRNFAPLRQKAANYYFFEKNFGTFKAMQFRASVFLGSLFRITVMTLAFPILFFKNKEQYKATISKHFYILLWSMSNRINT